MKTEPTSEPSPENPVSTDAPAAAELSGAQQLMTEWSRALDIPTGHLLVQRIFEVLKLAGPVRDSAVALVELAEQLRGDGNYRAARDVAELVGHTLTQELLLRDLLARDAARKELYEDNERIIDKVAAQLARENAGGAGPEGRHLAVVPQALEVGRAEYDIHEPPVGPPAPADRRRVGWVEVVPGTLARVVGGTLRGLKLGDVVLRWPEPVNGQTGTWLIFQGQMTHQSLPSWGWMPQDAVPWGKELELEVLAEGLDQRQCGDPAGLLRMYGG